MAKKSKKTHSARKQRAAKKKRENKKKKAGSGGSYESQFEAVVATLEQDELQENLLNSHQLLDEPELSWVSFDPEKAATTTRTLEEKYREDLEKAEDAATKRGIMERVYSDALGRLINRAALFRMKSALRTLALRAQRAEENEKMLQAICAEGMFRADIHVSAHPTLIVAYEKARNEGLGEELPEFTSFNWIEERKKQLSGDESMDAPTVEDASEEE